MKKFRLLVLALTLLFVLSPAAFAASRETYRLDDLGMSIDIPSEYVVFTRDIADDDPNLSAYGLNKNDLSDLMESRNLYLDIWDTYVSFEITVTMTDNSISDFNLISDTALNVLASSFTDEFASYGLTIETWEIYQHDQAKFLKIYENMPKGTDMVYGLQYYTVYDHKAISITMSSYSGAIDAEKEAILASILDTVHFDQEPLRRETPPDTAAFLFRDEDTGCEFTVPANWTQKPLSQERETIDVKFASSREPGLCILYGSTDIWSEMPLSEKIGLTRADIDNSLFTGLEEFAETMGVEKNKTSMLSYGGNEYYTYSNTTTASEYGIDLRITQTCFMRVENGYLYTFQFNGDIAGPYYDDFESLLESVKYQAVELSNHEDASDKSLPSSYGAAAGRTSPSNYTQPAVSPPPYEPDYSIASILLSLFITITIYSVPIFVYRYAVIKQPVEKKRAKKITIIYAAIAFAVMFFLHFLINGNGATSGGAIVFWSWVNYDVLTRGKKQPAENQSTWVSQTAAPVGAQQESTLQTKKLISEPGLPEITREPQPDPGEEDVVFCHQCGAKLNKSHHFCYKCGAEVVK